MMQGFIDHRMVMVVGLVSTLTSWQSVTESQIPIVTSLHVEARKM